jgi:uncharacterized linocin/CFP29 family protein
VIPNTDFLEWLIKRLVYKHQYEPNDPIIKNLKVIRHKLQNGPNIKDKDLDTIISKYFVDFLLDKTEDINIGYSDKDRIFLRSSIRSIIQDVFNKDINP